MILGILTTGGEFLNIRATWHDVRFAYFVIPPLGIGIIAYAIEYIKKSVELKHQLIKVEKLKAVEQMGAAISHEIRNPLLLQVGLYSYSMMIISLGIKEGIFVNRKG